MKKNILLISGSTRANSTCQIILNTIAERFRSSAEFELLEGLDTLPHFDPDAEEAGLPLPALQLRDKIAKADAVIFCTPEYVFSVPAILKNAIEWCVASTVFTDKPTAMIVASGVGEKTFESLALILKTIQTRLEPETLIHLKGIRGRMQGESPLTDVTALEKIDLMWSTLQAMSTSHV